jgi:DNA uptake protein ComE-like DNA-binding protein
MRRAVLIGIAGGAVVAALAWLSRPRPFFEPPTSTLAADEAGKSKVDVNQASREDLLRVPGMSPELADRIIRSRPYRKLDDLVTRKVCGKKEFARIREYIAVRPSS